jgi:hypothetical protein
VVLPFLSQPTEGIEQSTKRLLSLVHESFTSITTFSDASENLLRLHLFLVKLGMSLGSLHESTEMAKLENEIAIHSNR